MTMKTLLTILALSITAFGQKGKPLAANFSVGPTATTYQDSTE